jgi:hypothetical protein
MAQEQLAGLLSDATADVRKAATEGVERLIAVKGPGVLKELEGMGVRAALIKALAAGEGEEGATAVGSENNPNEGNAPLVRRAGKNEKEGG